MPTTITTDSGLLQRLSAAARRGATVEERRLQRVSFVYGNMPKGSAMTKNQVERALEDMDAKEGRA